MFNTHAVDAAGPIGSDGHLDWIEIPVVGLSHDGRADRIRSSVIFGLVVFLQRDPNNIYDPNAIRVILGDGLDIGFIPRVVSRDLAIDLDEGMLYDCYVSYVDSEVDYKNPDLTIHLDLVRDQGELQGQV
jgi:hypothetical protein